MNIGDSIYFVGDNAQFFQADRLRNGVKEPFSTISADDLEDNYGFEDAIDDWVCKTQRGKSSGKITDRIIFEGQEYAEVELKAVHFDDGHDGFLGIGSTPSQIRSFTVKTIAVLSKEITSVKPSDFTDEGVGSTAIKESGKVPKSATGSGGDTPAPKSNTGLYVGLGLLGLAIIGGIAWLLNRK